MSDPVARLNAALEGRYAIERELGEGGMATVYLADDLKHNRKVALKVLKPELAAVVGAERFLAEIKTTANLTHPHILPLFDSGEAKGGRICGGYHPSLIPFLKERDVALLGSDVPQEGGQVEGVQAPIHVFTLVSLGVHLFDNLGLEELAQTANELGRWEFMFMASPHGVPHGAGAALNPIAVF